MTKSFGPLATCLPSTFFHSSSCFSESSSHSLLNLKGKKFGVALEIPDKSLTSSWIKRLVERLDEIIDQYVISEEEEMLMKFPSWCLLHVKKDDELTDIIPFS
ncbi:hypothetical protein HZS_5171, partial [Henneguya salminicola]